MRSALLIPAFALAFLLAGQAALGQQAQPTDETVKTSAATLEAPVSDDPPTATAGPELRQNTAARIHAPADEATPQHSGTEMRQDAAATLIIDHERRGRPQQQKR